jgi:hypothetical protein
MPDRKFITFIGIVKNLARHVTLIERLRKDQFMIVLKGIGAFCLLATFFPAMIFCQNQLHLIGTLSGDSTGDNFSVVAGVGDVNGDGYADFVVGAPGGNYAKVFFGGPAFDTTRYVKLTCEQKGSRFGYSVAGGDINGDGYSDIVIGAPHYWVGGQFGIVDAGKVYVYFGGATFDTIAGLTFAPGGWYYNFGQSLCIAGDLNGDGFSDVVIGAPNDDIDAHGRVYIYFGGSPMADTFAIRLEGEYSADSFGESVAGVDDVNKDGFGDILIGAPQGLKYPYAGKAYLIYGGQNISLTNSVVFEGDSSAHGQFGRAVAGLGDVNGDSISDFGIMADNYIKIISGINLSTVLRINADSLWLAFQTIASVNDLDNDGLKDFCIGIQDRGNQYSGLVAVYSAVSSIDTMPAYIINGVGQNNYFGCSIAGIGKICDSALAEIIIAENNAFGINGPGRIHIYSFQRPDEVEREDSSQPKNFKLSQNYPNPFNPATCIQYTVNSRQIVSLKVYDVLGRELRTLVDGIRNPGTYEVQFNGSYLASGVYFYRLKAMSGVLQKKMILLR